MKPFTVLGTWWFPESPNSTFAAQLKISVTNGPILLPTIFEFTPVFMQRYGESNSIKDVTSVDGSPHQDSIILGIAMGRMYTLASCQVSLTEAFAGLVVEGTHFESLKEIAFSAYSISLSGLNEWGASGS